LLKRRNELNGNILENIKKSIRNIPDFPRQGIGFKDITPLLKDGDLFAEAIDYMYDHYRDKEIELITAIESRGFIFGAALAYKLNIGFVPIRKPGKLPGETISETYQLEYGEDSLEMHKDAIMPGNKVLLVDDLLATGGSAGAACNLIESLKGIVTGIVFLIELTFLNGREKLLKYDIHTLINYDTE
jgi:adenine phosphoribosyltransferase